MILTFHKCKLCGAIFHFGNKTSYCSKCIPKSNGWSEGYSIALNYGFILAERRKREQQQLKEYFLEERNATKK